MSMSVFVTLTVLAYGFGFKFVNCGTEPSHLAVINGSRALFNCSRDRIIPFTGLWTFYSVEEPSKGIQIFNGHQVLYPYNGSFWVDLSLRGHFNLMKNVATFEDAGTYQCYRSLDDKFHAELIVLGSDPVCQLNQNTTNDTVSLIGELRMWCSVEFRGNWHPTMEWARVNGRVIKTGVSSNLTSNNFTQIFTSHLRLPASSVEKDGIQFSCVTSFDEHLQKNTQRHESKLANYGPDYVHRWTSPTIHGEYESPLYLILIGVGVTLGCVVIFAIACSMVKRKSKQNTLEDTKEGFKYVNCATEPSNLAVINGSRASFKCSRDNMNSSTGLWTFYSLEESSKVMQIFNGHNVRYPYNGSFWLNSSSRGQYDLMKNIATLEDAGTYQCSRSLDTIFHAELVVLVSEPTCRLEFEMSMKDDIAFLSNKLSIHCRLEFRGNLIPSMEWRTEYGKVLETGVTETLRGNVSDQILTSTIRLPIFAIENGVKICCETSFGETSFRNVSRRSGSAMARNRPDYTHAWMSPTLYTDCLEPVDCCNTPINNVVLEGHSTSLLCSRKQSSHGLQIQWKFSPTDGSTGKLDIHNGSRMLDQFKGRFYLNRTFCDQTDLMGHSTVHKDAGTYRCDPDGDHMYSAELIVLTSDPVCQLNQNITNDTVVVTDELQIRCTVVYSGMLRPSMKWETSDGRVLTSDVTSEPHNTSGRIFTSTLVLSVNSVSKRGIHVRCVTFFEIDVSRNIPHKNKSTRATNNPDYLHTWTSPMLHGEYSEPEITTFSNHTDKRNSTYRVNGSTELYWTKFVKQDVYFLLAIGVLSTAVVILIIVLVVNKSKHEKILAKATVDNRYYATLRCPDVNAPREVESPVSMETRIESLIYEEMTLFRDDPAPPEHAC